MSLIDEKSVVTIVLAALGGAGTALVSHVRLGGRVRELEKGAKTAKTDMSKVQEDVSDIKEDVAYIRGVIDAAVKD